MTKAKKAKKAVKRVRKSKHICRHGRDTYASDCGMCDMYGSDEHVRNLRRKAPRKSVVAIARFVDEHAGAYGPYAVSLAEEILRLEKVHPNDNW